jgi:hypothetical protein
MTRDFVLWHLREATEAITQMVAEMEADSDYSEGELMIAMGHLYHHLNTAWNARNASLGRTHKCNARDFKAWSRFPRDLVVLGTA